MYNNKQNKQFGEVQAFPARAPAAALRRLFPRRISPRSASHSFSLRAWSAFRAFPIAPGACASRPPFALLLPFPPPLVPLPYPYPWLPPDCPDISGSGNRDGSSSTDREWGLSSGPVVTGPEPLDAFAPFPNPGCPPGTGVGGGEVPPPILFRSLRVMCGRDCESTPPSGSEGRCASHRARVSARR